MQRRYLHQQQPQPQQQLHAATHPSSVISKGSATTSTTLSQQQQQHLPAPTNVLQKQQPLFSSNNNINPSQQSLNRSTLSKPHAVPTSLNTGSTHSHNRNNSGSSSILRTWVLITIIMVLTFLISLFPEERQMMYDTEQQVEKVVLETEHQIEREVMDYWLSSKQFYTGDSSDTTTTTTGSKTSSSYDADVRMQQQSSKWVDDEKKLKKALQVLVERQAQGFDLGVPVLTRYLGENIPVFYSKDDTSLNRGINTIEEWNTIIEEKYTEMRNEENHWREIVTSTLLSDRG